MFLIEKFPTETPHDVQIFLEALIVEIYGRRPEWLDYELAGCYRFRSQEFVRMYCPAGSVHGHIYLRAWTGDGITRDILEIGTREGHSYAWLLHNGIKSEYDSHEVEPVG